MRTPRARWRVAGTGLVLAGVLAGVAVQAGEKAAEQLPPVVVRQKRVSVALWPPRSCRGCPEYVLSAEPADRHKLQRLYTCSIDGVGTLLPAVSISIRRGRLTWHVRRIQQRRSTLTAKAGRAGRPLEAGGI